MLPYGGHRMILLSHLTTTLSLHMAQNIACFSHSAITGKSVFISTLDSSKVGNTEDKTEMTGVA
jgi:hypothetical protein